MGTSRAGRSGVATMMVGCAVLAVGVAAQEDESALRAVLARTAAYLETYERDLSSVVARERYHQVAYPGTENQRERVMVSDFLLLHSPNGEGWIPFRDVYEVDGRLVRDREERLRKLFLERPQTALQDARRIKEEGLRFSLAEPPFRSNINWPTFALEFLRVRNQPRFHFSKDCEEKVGGVPTWRISYSETAKPTLVRTYDGFNLSADGDFWIEPGRGEIVQTRLITLHRGIRMSLTVLFARSDALGLLVPVRMTEQFSFNTRTLLDGDAGYTDFRKFSVSTGVVVRDP